VLGQVKKPGKVIFPIEANGMDIRDVVSQAGGFTNIARSREVRVTRVSADGQEQALTVNVEQMLSGRGADGAAQSFLVLPGDIVFVPERFF
jgi:protein involved in polysaccharide export with SLBB domain